LLKNYTALHNKQRKEDIHMLYRNILNRPYWTDRRNLVEFDRLKREMDRLFAGFGDYGRPTLRSGVFPAMNLTQNAHNYFLRAELPGINAQDLNITSADNAIAISGERKIPAEEGVKYHRSERDSGKFSRVINLPGEIDAERIEANLRNGILTLVIPKAEKVKPRQISVKRES
jgi:HSP20 family protein